MLAGGNDKQRAATLGTAAEEQKGERKQQEGREARRGANHGQSPWTYLANAKKRTRKVRGRFAAILSWGMDFSTTNLMRN
jgi:hypothetical protein